MIHFCVSDFCVRACACALFTREMNALQPDLMKNNQHIWWNEGQNWRNTSIDRWDVKKRWVICFQLPAKRAGRSKKKKIMKNTFFVSLPCYKLLDVLWIQVCKKKLHGEHTLFYVSSMDLFMYLFTPYHIEFLCVEVFCFLPLDFREIVCCFNVNFMMNF